MSRLDDPESVNMRLLSEPDVQNEAWDLPSSHGSTRGQKSNFVPLLGRSRLSFRVLCVLLVFTSLGLLVSVSREPIVHNIKNWRNSVASAFEGYSQTPGHSDHSLYVTGPPSSRFRDNLVNGTKYITAWPIGGFTNQVIGQINLLYLALLALRIPVIADFIPGHMHGNPGWLPVSKVFDLPRLADSLNIPVLEWNEFKNNTPPRKTEYLGCWSVHSTIFHEGGHYASEVEFGLDISLTPVPDSRFRGDTENMQDVMALASLSWPEARAAALRGATTLPSPANQKVILPDEDMLCFDELYYANSVKAYEWEEDWVPMWTQVGKYLRWEPNMENLARSYIKRAFRLGDSDPFPAYISVHIRHTDFAQLCRDNDTTSCFPSLSAYGEKVDEVRAELLETRGMHVDSVFVASDEEDPAWWALVEQRGWHRIDWVAEGTEAMYSEWYPIVLDSVALSLGKGFVGTTRSTLSLLASKRVQDWEDGPVRKLKLNY